MEQGLQAFIRQYEQNYPDDVLHIDRPIDAKFEVTALVAKLQEANHFPVLVFHNVIKEGKQLPYPLVTFMMSSRDRLARLLGSSSEQAGINFFKRMENKLQPVIIEPAEAPIKEVILRGDSIDLQQFPALWHHSRDPGHYITAGFLTSYNPETGLENSAIHRGWIAGPQEIRMELGHGSHNAYLYREHKAQQKDMRVAYWIGHHPLVMLGCEARISITESHFQTAGGVLGEPLRLVPSTTLGDDFLVPADAEIIIEGYIPYDRTAPEGPFGEYTRYFGTPRDANPVLQVTAVTHRRQPWWQSVMVGYTHWISSLQNEGAAYFNVKRQVPALTNVYMPMSGCGVSHLYLQLNRPTREIARAALLAGLNAHYTIKHVFAFDEDINIFNDHDALWALATRFQGDQDMIVVPNTLSSPLDPSGHHNSGTKIGFDCTKGRDDFPERVTVPPETFDKIKLEDYIPAIARP